MVEVRECIDAQGKNFYRDWLVGSEPQLARLFFGLFVCQVLIERDEEWNVFTKAEKEEGTIYRRS